MKKTLLFITLFILLILSGCAQNADFLARVGETTIEQKDWEEQLLLTRISYDLSQTQMPDSGEAYENLKKNLMDNILESVILLEEAQERSITGDQDTADEEAQLLLDAIEALYGQEGLSALLEEFQMDEEQFQQMIFRKSMENQIIYQLYNEVTKDVTASSQELEEYYSDHLDYFNYTTVYVKGFVLTSSETGEALSKEILEEDVQVEELLESYQNQENVLFSGDFGPVFYSNVEEAFAQVLFDTQVGEWTSLVETQGLYYLGFVYGKEPMDPIPFEDVADVVEERVLSVKRSAVYEAFVKDAFEARDVEVYYDKL